jgi:hypothetical protein
MKSSKDKKPRRGCPVRVLGEMSLNSPRARIVLHTQRTHTLNSPVFARVLSWPVVTVSSAGVRHA